MIVTPQASGNEGAAIPLAIWAGLSDTNGSESLSVQITGVPEFAVLSSGTKNADGSWTITTSETSIDLIGMSLTSLQNGVFTLTVAATATETTNGTVNTTSASIEVAVDNVAPEITTLDLESWDTTVGLTVDFSDAGLLDTHSLAHRQTITF